MPRTIPDRGCAPTRPPRAPEKGLLNRSLCGQEDGPRIGKSLARHRATLQLPGTLEASVSSRQPFTWLNAVYLRVFRSHLQV